MSEDFLGVGWGFPVRVGETGQVEMASYEESIRQSILIILGTAPGERVMRPEFGCDLVSLVFEDNNMATAGLAAHYVQEALVQWEPRIELISVQGKPNLAGAGVRDPSCMLLEIDYTVIRTNSVFNLVYPFYLTEGVDA